MVYTPEEKLRMDKLLEVFEYYIAESQEMDIAYAPKTGYVWLVVAENADWVYFPVKGYDDLLEKLCSCMVMEEEERSVVSVGDYSMVDTQRPRELLSARLHRLDENRGYALGKMEEYLARWSKQLACFMRTKL